MFVDLLQILATVQLSSKYQKLEQLKKYFAVIIPTCYGNNSRCLTTHLNNKPIIFL